MTQKKPKFYVVWQGLAPGVYTTWDACQAQINGFSNAKYKSFDTLAKAHAAYQQEADQHWGKSESAVKKLVTPVIDAEELADLGVDMTGWCVDAACKGNPGVLEYQGVELSSGINMFHMGPYPEGTVNIGEFLAVVHALALLHEKEPYTPIYSDSRTAMSWITQGKCNTKLPPSNDNRRLFNLVERAEKWLAEHRWTNPILKWKTKIWGEIPADFGRK